jgi:hypothetical protein
VNIESILRSSGADTKVNIIAGDLLEGNWELSGGTLKRPPGQSTTITEPVNLANNISKLDLKDQINKDSLEPVVTAGIGALLGLRFFGFIGAAGGAALGLLFSNNHPQVSITCKLKDGRQFLAVMSPQAYQLMRQYI